MTLNQVMSELQKLGTEQNRKIYSRHGISGEMFGERTAIPVNSILKILRYLKTVKSAPKLKVNIPINIFTIINYFHDIFV